MNKHRPLCLIKFGKKKDMRELVDNGVLYFQRLSTYQKSEDAERGDENENLSHSWQSNKIKLEINGQIISGIVGPVRIRNYNENPLAYCMYSITTAHIDMPDGKFIDEKCYKFGDTAVVIMNGSEFLSRIKAACESIGAGYKGKLVEYVDYNLYHGEMGPFKKYKQWFGHQSEFRFLLHSDSTDKDFKLTLGSLSDITQTWEVSRLNKLLKINT